MEMTVFRNFDNAVTAAVTIGIFVLATLAAC